MNNALELFVGDLIDGYRGRGAVPHAEFAADASFRDELYPRTELVALFRFNERIVFRRRFF